MDGNILLVFIIKNRLNFYKLHFADISQKQLQYENRIISVTEMVRFNWEKP